MSIKLRLHTSDWPIGRLFQNIVLLDDQLYVLKQLKAYAMEHEVDAMIIASDIFDRWVPPAEAVDALNGISYHDPVEVREAFDCEVKNYDQAHTYLVEHIKAVRSVDIPAVLISHCFIDGAEESESERPLSIGGADRVSYEPLKDFDYVALGHLHAPQYKGVEH
ncbi:MAG: hypothetical protein P1P93_11000 [Gammaproteobacteria bacterium]|nr:hypothetical protein [Gammaproteobacteria bacterium]